MQVWWHENIFAKTPIILVKTARKFPVPCSQDQLMCCFTLVKCWALQRHFLPVLCPEWASNNHTPNKGVTNLTGVKPCFYTKHFIPTLTNDSSGTETEPLSWQTVATENTSYNVWGKENLGKDNVVKTPSLWKLLWELSSAFQVHTTIFNLCSYNYIKQRQDLKIQV